MDPNAELDLAREAINAGDFNLAQHHLNAAKSDGAEPEVVAQMELQLQRRMRELSKVGKTGHIVALVLSLIGYGLVESRPPSSWGVPVWAACAFLIVPAICGLVIARSTPPDAQTRSQAFWWAWLIAGACMAGYTAGNLSSLSAGISTHSTSTQAPVVIVMVTIIYGTLAGLVAGIVSVVFRRTVR